ncbi:hypothetical protein E2562_010083 [Oryza meyeriana var. granulata]|uniref:Seipin n=1 Tax=Oryza meyeriana var. granulata TaxID=110450 RepID=A0A6G1EIJ6_9ORYZ|nr:hypothetical protein E2562_010083 [Oryza meyeriana var. granulata]
MEADESPAASTSLNSDDAFFDALDSLPFPPPPHTPSSSTLRRRPRRGRSLKQHEETTAPSPTFSDSSTITVVDEAIKPDSSEGTSSHRPPPPPEEEDEEDAAAAEEVVEARETKLTTAATPSPTPTPGILESLAVLVIKAVVFQVSALISCLTFPIRLLQWWFLFVTDPLGLARRARAWALGMAEQATGAVAARLGGGEGVGRMAARLAWGSLWAVYVCVVLCSILVMAFLAGGLLVGKVVEEPIQVTETLNFDYTKPSPVAFVPVQRLVPPNQRMQLEVFLMLPESDYNRRLGVFQDLEIKQPYGYVVAGGAEVGQNAFAITVGLVLYLPSSTTHQTMVRSLPCGLGDAKVAFRVRTNYHKRKWAWQYCIIKWRLLVLSSASTILKWAQTRHQRFRLEDTW